MLVLRAKYVFPIDGPPLRDGIVAIEGNKIVAVGDATTAKVRDLIGNAIDLANFAILPGFVNAHTHIELNNFGRPLGQPGMSFPDWIRAVVEFQRTRRQQMSEGGPSLSQSDALIADLSYGSVQLMQASTTTVGDIESGINTPLRNVRTEFLKSYRQPFELTSFLEVISLKEATLNDVVRVLAAELDLRQASADIVRRAGISPHAPYTVHPKLLAVCVELSAARSVPVAHHLAESREELMLLRAGRGPFVKLLEDFNAWDPEAIPFGSRPLDYLKQLAKSHRSLVIHGNYLDDEEIAFAGAHADNMSIVYCPRTHAYFKHDPYPLAKMLAAGVNVALGTDSRASNPDLSVLNEMRFAAKLHPLVSPQLLLRMITVHGARALGRDAEVGSLTQGKFADFTILALPNYNTADPHELLFDPNSTIVGSMFRGQPMWKTGGCPSLTTGNS